MIEDTDARRAYVETRSKLPCIAAEWTGGADRFAAVALVVFALALVAMALTWAI